MNSPKIEVRLDKWLWAARFYKTRNIAKQAIEAGHVQYEGARVKVSKEVDIGASLKIKQGYDNKTVVILALDDKRKSATHAEKLYEETQESIEKRLS